MTDIELNDPAYDSWNSSSHGPVWQRSGCEATATYLAADGITYKLIYHRGYPASTVYVATQVSNPSATQCFMSLKAASQSPHFRAFQALLAFVRSHGVA